jgi:hypothetical protein
MCYSITTLQSVVSTLEKPLPLIKVKANSVMEDDVAGMEMQMRAAGQDNLIHLAGNLH